MKAKKLNSGSYRVQVVAGVGTGGKLRKLIRLSKSEEVVACLIIGYPAVKYQRIAPRKKLKAKIL